MKLKEFVRRVEKTAIERALDKNGWFETKAAKELGISRGTLRSRRKELGI
jgi:DNA-binding NtrC family response regulator